MKIKKEGSSLIFVVIMFMFVMVVSTAMLSMVLGNYESRIVENKRVENLYGADAGINVASNVIEKTFDAATKYGYFCRKELLSNSTNAQLKFGDEYTAINNDITQLESEIQTLKEQESNSDSEIEKKRNQIAKNNQVIEEDNKLLEILLDEEFKAGFRSFFEKRSDADGNEQESILKQSINEKKYVNEVKSLTDIRSETVDYLAANDTSKDLEFDTDISDAYNLNNKEDSNIEIKKIDGHKVDDFSFTKTEEKAYNIKVTSDFESSTSAKSIGNNKRTIQVDYVVKVPNYEDIFFEQSNGKEYLALNDRALTVGGNMEINTELNIDGNTFVQGNEPTVDLGNVNRTYEKYTGGILLNNDTSRKQIIFNGDVITRNSFNIQDKIKANIDGNLYARNVYLGKTTEKDDGFAEKSELKVGIKDNNEADDNDDKGKVVIDNDLTLKALDSKIGIKSFYGINDKNIEYKDLNTNINNSIGDMEKSSSSIIVNGYKKNGENSSSIKIYDTAYIMGTAHIATNKNYQTGESTAVKGNYIVYSNIVDNESSTNEGDFTFLDSDNVFYKTKKFIDYWSQPGNEADTGGIELPSNVYSIGAIVYKDSNGKASVRMGNYSPDLENTGGEIYNKRVEFASKVYRFGQPSSIDDYDNTNKMDFESLMNLSLLPVDYDLESEKDKNEKAIFVNDKKTTLILKGNNSINITLEDGKIGNEIASKNGKIYAVIATDGDVIIDGDV